MKIDAFPKISIITPSLNQSNFIEDNIKSVLEQDYPNFEHIIIDGGSNDGTLEILKKYSHIKWISEKDKGQSDALNKGIKMATGDIIGWLNADDFYCKNIFKDIVKAYIKNPKSWYIGNIILYDNETKIHIYDKTPNIRKLLKFNPYVVRQAGAFYSKYILDKIGGFNPNFFMVMDYDLWIRLLKISEPEILNIYVSYFRIHKNQKSNFKNLKTQTKELIEIIFREKNYISIIFITLMILKRISKNMLKTLLKLN